MCGVILCQHICLMSVCYDYEIVHGASKPKWLCLPENALKSKHLEIS